MATHPTPLRASAHHAYQSWTSSWYDEQGHRRTKRFGRTDEVTRKIANARYQNWLNNEWRAKAHVRNPVDPMTYRIADLCEAYRRTAAKIYVKNDRQTSSIDNVEAAMLALESGYGDSAADDFGAPDLDALLETMIFGPDRHGKVRARALSTVNGRLRIIKQAFKWARRKGLVSKATAYDVAMVSPLRAGRCEAKPAKIVKPVPETILAATIAGATPTLADMIRVMLLTGMRPGELTSMRVCDIEASGDVWQYHPTSHKTQHHGKMRDIFIGPKAQEIIKRYIARRDKLTEFVFLPVESHRERMEQIGFEKVTAYHCSRSRFKPGRQFKTDTFYSQVCRTCDRVFDPTGVKVKAHDYAHRWHPHQLRHNAATRLREQFGIEVAQDVLGHSSLQMAMIYAEKSVEKVRDVMRVAG